MFVDKHGSPNAYVDMNPSLYIKESGECIVLVRRVNYRKFHTKEFNLYERSSNSCYGVAWGVVQDNRFVLGEWREGTLLSDLPSYPTYWTGMEDIRFCDELHVLVALPEKNPTGNPCIFLGQLADSTIHSLQLCSPHEVEKNWMPYTDPSGSSKVVYSVSPFQIKSLVEGTLTTIPTPFTTLLQDYHGSTNGIVYKEDSRLFLVHKHKERSVHRWLLYTTLTHTVHVSEPFVFFDNSYIEFPCSLASYKGTYYVSLGVNDSQAFLVQINPTTVEKMLSLSTP